MLRPSLERLSSYEEAARAVAMIEANEARSASAPPGSLGAIEEEESDDENGQDNSGSDDNDEGMLRPCKSVSLNTNRTYMRPSRTRCMQHKQHSSKQPSALCLWQVSIHRAPWCCEQCIVCL